MKPNDKPINTKEELVRIERKRARQRVKVANGKRIKCKFVNRNLEEYGLKVEVPKMDAYAIRGLLREQEKQKPEYTMRKYK